MSSLELPENPLIGALLRLPAQAIHRRIVAELNRAGFRDLRLPHMAVLQYPGPDGRRPGELAERAGMSKQAMNRLLQSLERLGYVRRHDSSESGRARIVRFTKRGSAAWGRIHEILADIEAEWQATLGERDFTRLKKLLCDVWVSDLVP
ncbi:MAG TPA: MarR family winged helix-turn-helix transcriptional regulator [Candidatus Saccharimonadales bacterium]|nr:MarR family winged helix-turn-helix transcriptional regulator [Candidatus Saccharimonadales bacterium]